jgi:hypothetical protein
MAKQVKPVLLSKLAASWGIPEETLEQTVRNRLIAHWKSGKRFYVWPKEQRRLRRIFHIPRNPNLHSVQL